MLWLHFLVAVALVDGASLRNHTSFNQSLDNGTVLQEEELQYVQSQYKKMSDNFLESFARAHSHEEKRIKRQVAASKSILLADNTGVFRLNSVKPLMALCSPAVDIKLLDVNNVTYAACVSIGPENSNATVHLGYISSNWHELKKWNVVDPKGLLLFFDRDILYVLVVDQNNVKGIDLVGYNVSSNTLRVDHTVNCRCPTSANVWRMKNDGLYHLAVANSACKKRDDLSTYISIYVWKGTYFDEYATVPAYDVRDIEPFHIHNSAYLAVANHRKLENDFLVNSEIFKYYPGENPWRSQQKIRTYGALDWEFFNFGEGTGMEFFLAVAINARYDPTVNVNSVIYKFVNDTFVSFQCLETFGATSVAAVRDGQKFLLAIANEDDGVYLYQYDGWRFIRARLQYTQMSMALGVVALSFHKVSKEDVIILSVSNRSPRYSHEPSLFQIEFVEENSLKPWYDRNVEWCMDKYETYQDPDSSIRDLNLKKVFFVDQEEPIVINGDIVFDADVEAAKLTTTKLNILNSVEQVFDNTYLSKLQNLNERLKELRDKIKEISEVLSKALRTVGNQEITAVHEFRDVGFLCESNFCYFDSFVTTMLNGEDVSNLKDNVIFLDDSNRVKGSLNVENITAGEVTVHGLVDGLDFDTVVTKSGNYTFTGFNEFTKPIQARDVEVRGLVDNIRFSSDSILLTNGYQNVTGNLYFENIRTKWLEISGFLNKVDLTKFLQDVVLTDGTYSINGEKTFTNVSVKQLDMNPSSTINGIDLQDLWSHTLWKEGYQLVTAPMHFQSLEVQNFNVDGGINGFDILGPRVFLIDQDTKVVAPQLFNEIATLHKLNVKDSINGISVNSETGELNLLTNKGQQVILGEKTFHRIVLDDHSFVAGTVNGIDLSEFHMNSIHSDVPLPTSGEWKFKNVIVEGPLFVGGSVSGINLADFYNNALKLNETEITNTFEFQAPVSIREFESDNINGINIKRDLVLVNEPQTIRGVKTFKDIILRDDSSVSGRVNQIDLGFLKDTVLRIGNQYITSKKVIAGDLKVKKLTVKGTINGINFDEVAVLTDNVAVIGPKVLSNVTFNQLSVLTMKNSGFVNGIDVVKMMMDTMTYDGFQNVTGNKFLNGVLKLPAGSSLLSNNFNGINLSELYSDAVFVEQDQSIGGMKYFMAPVIFNHLTVNGLIDGVSDWDMKHNWMLQNVDSTITGDTYFTDVFSPKVIVDGLINNVNITLLNEQLLKTTEMSSINVPIIFEGSLISKGDITLSGLIQGIDLSEVAALKTKDNVFVGRKHFAEDVVFDGNLVVSGYVDGLSITDLCENVILLNRDKGFKSLVIVGNVMFDRGGNVIGTISGVNITSLYESTVSFIDAETFINGVKSFENLTVEGNLHVMGKFGGIDIADLANSYMSLSRHQDIGVTHSFEELYINGALYATNLYTSTQELSGVDIKDLERRTLKTVGQQVISATYTFSELKFEDDVAVVGKVNGIEIPKGLMQRNRTTYIRSPKKFSRPVKILGDLEMEDGKTIQGVDVSAWLTGAVRKSRGSYEIRGMKTFKSASVGNIGVNGLLDGLKISEDNLLLTYGDQIITGKKTFTQSVQISRDLTVLGLINGVNLLSLAQRAVRRDVNSTIVAMKTFKRPLTVKNLEVEEINDVRVAELERLVNTDVSYYDQAHSLDIIGGFISDIRTALDRQAVFVQYYDFLQTFENPEAYSWLHVGTGYRDFLLLSDFTQFPNGCSSVRIYEYREDTKTFELRNESLISSFSVSMQTFKAWGATFVVIAGNKPNINCFSANASIEVTDDIGENPSTIYYYEASSNAFLPYQNFKTLPVVDVVTFTDDTVACAVFVEIYDTVVYCAKDVFHNFIWHEKLPTPGGRKASVIETDGKIVLALASIDTLQAGFQQFVDIYVWNSHKQTFGSPVQVKETAHVESVMLLSHLNFNITETYLFVSEGTVPRIGNAPKLTVYKLDGETFSKYQEIEDSGELAWTTSPSGKLMLFTLNKRSGILNIYMLKGASRFVKFYTITSEGATTMHVFKRSVADSDLSHYIALAGLQDRMRNVYQDPNHIKILKSKITRRKT